MMTKNEELKFKEGKFIGTQIKAIAQGLLWGVTHILRKPKILSIKNKRNKIRTSWVGNTKLQVTNIYYLLIFRNKSLPTSV